MSSHQEQQQADASGSRQPTASSSKTTRTTTDTPSSSHTSLITQTALVQRAAPLTRRDEQALVKATERSQTTAGGRSLDRQVILEEDAYADSLDRIIKRDFFPELARLDATVEYLAAVEEMDEGRLERSVRALWEIEGETGETPRFPGGRHSETPIPFDRLPRRRPIPSSASTIARAAHLPNLDRFQASHTSEDNASFTSILASENAARKSKYAWAYDGEGVVRKKLEEGEGRWRRLLEGVPRSADERQAMVEDASARERLRISGPSATATTTTSAIGLSSDGDPKGVGKAREIIPTPASAPSSARLSSVSSSSVVALSGETSAGTAGTEKALVRPFAAGASPREPLSPPLPPTDLPLEPDSHLALALRAAGLPPTRTDDRALAAHVERVAVGIQRKREEETKTTIEAWPWKARNSLMFSPDVDVSPHEVVRSSSSATSSHLPAGPPRSITHDATRLPEDFAYSVGNRRATSSRASSVSGGSPTRSEVAAAIAGTTYRRSTESATPRPYVGSYPLVAPLPSPTAASLSPSRISQLLTWGTLLSTPRAIDGSGGDKGVGGWTIKPPSKRDELGRRLAGQVSSHAKAAVSSDPSKAKRRRLDGAGGGLMLPPSSTSTRKTLAGMSPAARGLSERLKTGSLTPRPAGSSSLAGRNGGRQRGEAMERTAAWTGTKGTSTTVDLGRRRWSESPSPRHARGGVDD